MVTHEICKMVFITAGYWSLSSLLLSTSTAAWDPCSCVENTYFTIPGRSSMLSHLPLNMSTLLILRNVRESILYLTFLPTWFVIQMVGAAYCSRIFINRFQYLALTTVLCFLLDLCRVMSYCRHCENAWNWPKPFNLSWCFVLYLYPHIVFGRCQFWDIFLQVRPLSSGIASHVKLYISYAFLQVCFSRSKSFL